MELSEWVAEYATCKDLSDGYRGQLRFGVRSLDSFHGRKTKLSDLTPDLINAWLLDLRSRGQSPETRRSRRRIVITLWQAAADRGMADQPPRRLIMQPRRVDRPRKAWTQDEVQKLIHTAGGLNGRLGATGIDAASYWTSYIMAAWDTGLRGCDLRRIERRWITRSRRLQIVQHKTGRLHVVAIRESTLEAIDRSFPPSRRLIWPRWCCLRNWRIYARNLVKLAGLSGSIGRLRHASGTAAELAHPGRGHEHLGNTRQVFERHYLDPVIACSDPPMPPKLAG